MFDDTPVDFREAQFTIDEAAAITGVSAINLRSWGTRGSVKVGIKHKKLGRWMLSGLDLIRLRTINDLIETCGMSPSAAEPIGKAVAERFLEMGAQAGELASGERRDLRIVVSLVGGEPAAAFYQWDGETYAGPVPKRGSPNERFRRPHIIIPADTICFDVATAIFDLLRKEAEDAL